MALTEADGFPFLSGGGEMGKLIRTKDWSTTALGSPDSWPSSLRSSISILLNSQFPMFIWWGPEEITLYNDAYRLILGEKHPKALGAPGSKVWSEIWNIVGPLAERVQKQGESNWAEDQLLYINRRGFLEESYFTFSYSPMLNEVGGIAGVFCACTETTEKVLATRKLKESEQSLRKIILQAPVAMCILRGENFVIEVANEKMFELWGVASKGVVGLPLFEAVVEAKNEGYEELMTKVLTTGKPVVGREQPVSLPRNGRVETVFINFSYEAIRELDNTITGVMAMVTDVTEQVIARRKIEDLVSNRTEELAKVNEALMKTNRELASSNAKLEEFAYAASHDMKEPIRKVIVFSDRLKNSLRERMNETEISLFERMEKATQRMGLLVDDLLMFSHVSEKPLEMEEVDLNKKFENVLADLEMLIEEKQALIAVGRLPTVRGYRRQLQQLFQNLIGNALKYSKPDTRPEITLTCKVVKGDEIPSAAMQELPERSFYQVEVRDNGIGFEQKYAENIFGIFQRLHNKAEYEGTGVGLSIARKVVENHNGYIWANSQPGKGSTFHVLLPV
ncbi:ATP-binding protein [Segetibacter sp.]|jgi:PAS domain S-box-containing protein|uniref:PAS domain-containing sensor histidine kinase n=1 Tax=Segetibacter sp. TaxID=2231182 RepID=UPI00261CD0DD|nr:ATP-binding protein [Segetibacter sp.]MCW3079907.1 domain S-box protein [Segetibacter sp.]